MNPAIDSGLVTKEDALRYRELYVRLAPLCSVYLDAIGQGRFFDSVDGMEVEENGDISFTYTTRCRGNWDSEGATVPVLFYTDRLEWERQREAAKVEAAKQERIRLAAKEVDRRSASAMSLDDEFRIWLETQSVDPNTLTIAEARMYASQWAALSLSEVAEEIEATEAVRERIETPVPGQPGPVSRRRGMPSNEEVRDAAHLGVRGDE